MPFVYNSQLTDNSKGSGFRVPSVYTSIPGGTIFLRLTLLAKELSLIQNVTNTNLRNVQQIIEGSHPSFNTFVVATDAANAESLTGTGTLTGKTTFTGAGFVYNNSASGSNILSTSNPILPMSGGDAYSLPEVDGKGWMAMAVYDGSLNGFKGILLWSFTGDLINAAGTITTNGAPITRTRDIFYPQTAFRRIYPIVIGPLGQILEYDVSGNSGYTMSTAQAPNIVTGYNLTTKFSGDDGVWAFRLENRIGGNTTTYVGANGYGFGNVGSTDSSSTLVWDGVSSASTTYVGFVFTGDA